MDDEFLKIFPEKASDKGHTFPIHELWRPEFPFAAEDPRGARQLDEHVVSTQRPAFDALLSKYCKSAVEALVSGWEPGLEEDAEEAELRRSEAAKAFREVAWHVNKLIRDESLLDREFDQFGYNALRSLLDELKESADMWASEVPVTETVDRIPKPDIDKLTPDLQKIVREFAKLDGYNVWRRGQDAAEQPGKLQPTKDGKEERKPVVHSWIIPTRVWAKREAWGQDPETKEQIAKPTHDDKALVRADYLAWLRDKLGVFDRDGTVLEEHLDRLDPDCIEALALNLAAGRYKPFKFAPGDHRPPREMITELDAAHAAIRQRLERILQLIQGAE